MFDLLKNLIEKIKEIEIYFDKLMEKFIGNKHKIENTESSISSSLIKDGTTTSSPNIEQPFKSEISLDPIEDHIIDIYSNTGTVVNINTEIVVELEDDSKPSGFLGLIDDITKHIKNTGGKRGKTGKPKLIKTKNSQFDLICYKPTRSWSVGIQFKNEFINPDDINILQGENTLDYDYDNQQCELSNLNENIEINTSEKKYLISISSLKHDDGYFLFKLSNNYEKGNKVKLISSGKYLLIIPDDWKVNVSNDTEYIKLSGFKAYSIDVNTNLNQQIKLTKNDGVIITIRTNNVCFFVDGKRILGVSEEKGPLFIGETIPYIYTKKEEDWENVRSIVIGNEGYDKGGNKKNKPIINNSKWELPVDIRENGSGWQFVRFYNKNEEMLESFDFRYIPAIENIQIGNYNMLPDETGHTTIPITISHNETCKLQVENDILQLKHTNTISNFTVPSDAEYDKLNLIVKYANKKEQMISLLFDRIWWTFNEETVAKPDEWYSTPVELNRDWCKANSTKALFVRLPKLEWQKNIYIGFSNTNLLKFQIKQNMQDIKIPLRNLSGHFEENFIGTIQLKVGFAKDELAICGSLTVSYHCLYCNEFTSLSQEEIITHTWGNHENELIKEPTYQEIRRFMPRALSLPASIIVCGYNNEHVFSGEETYCTDTIIEHIVKEHPEANDHIRYRHLTKQDDIREFFLPTLPRIKVCKLCDKTMLKSEINQHIFDNHTLSKLY